MTNSTQKYIELSSNVNNYCVLCVNVFPKIFIFTQNLLEYDDVIKFDN